MTHRTQSRLRVLIADDEPGVLKSLARLLAYDYDVVGAVANGRALLEAAHQLQPDIIVLDLSFTDVDSLEACSLITQRDPRIKVIVFTGREDAAVWHRALEAGAVAVVSKLVGGDLLSELERLRHDEG